MDDRRLVNERPYREPKASADAAGDDRSVCAFFVFPTRACGHGASGGPRAGPDEHSQSEWLATHGDLTDGLSCEMLLVGSGLKRDLLGREAGQTTGRRSPGCVLDQEPIIKVDPKREVLERLKRLSRPSRRYDQHEGNQ